MKLSVLIISYNHEKYIAETLDGILMQQTQFDFEIVIGEDHSTDNTRNICIEYQKKHPNIIRILDRPTNLGMHKNFAETYYACEGEYVAMCEGDDYWTDPHKLQKQVDFLDSNKDFIICFHAAKELREDGSTSITNIGQKEITDIKDVLETGWYIRTASLVFRNKAFNQFPHWFYKVKATDYALHIILSKNNGKIKFINECMSVYRLHPNGISVNMHNNISKSLEDRILLFTYINQYTNYVYQKIISNKIFILKHNRYINYRYNHANKNYLKLLNFYISTIKENPKEFIKLRFHKK